MNQFKFRLILAMLLLGFAGFCAAGEKSYTIAVIPKGATHEFWRAVHAGAVKAQRELAEKGVKVEIIWKGPLREDDRESQIQVVENFMTRRVSGILLAPLDSQALASPVANAAKAGIPVVIFDSDLKSDKYISFVATDNYKGGQLAARRLGELLGGKGKIIVLRYGVGSASTEAREAGFLDTIKEKFPAIQVVSSDQYAGPTRETAFQAAQNLVNRFGRDLGGAFAPNENSAEGLTQALKESGKGGGKVKIVGFDAGAQSIADLRRGDVQGLVVQDPLRMGYLGVLTLAKYLGGGTVEKRIDTGVQLITPENMEEAGMKELLHPPLEKYLN